MSGRLVIYIIGVIWTAVAARAQVTYQQSDSVRICQLLQQKTGAADPVLSMARQFHGIPYVAHTLEVNDDERLVVNTRQLDCTTLVETVVALTLCRQQGKTRWADYLNQLQQLRYRQGKLQGYDSRLHYFSDWIVDKQQMQLVEEVQQPNPPFTALQRLDINYMSSHPQVYKALKASPQLVERIRIQETALTGRTFRYIPKQRTGNNRLMRKAVRDGDIIAITCNKRGLDIAHLGFAVWQKDGLHLLNASQLHKKVVTEPMTLYQYLRRHPSHTGIRVIRIKEYNNKK